MTNLASVPLATDNTSNLTAVSDWNAEAACLGRSDLFFDPYRRAEAAHICQAHCPLLAACHARLDTIRPFDCVAAGIAWSARRSAPTPREKQPAPRSCPQCRAAETPEPRRDLTPAQQASRLRRSTMQSAKRRAERRTRLEEQAAQLCA